MDRLRSIVERIRRVESHFNTRITKQFVQSLFLGTTTAEHMLNELGAPVEAVYEIRMRVLRGEIPSGSEERLPLPRHGLADEVAFLAFRSDPAVLAENYALIRDRLILLNSGLLFRVYVLALTLYSVLESNAELARGEAVLDSWPLFAQVAHPVFAVDYESHDVLLNALTIFCRSQPPASDSVRLFAEDAAVLACQFALAHEYTHQRLSHTVDLELLPLGLRHGLEYTADWMAWKHLVQLYPYKSLSRSRQIQQRSEAVWMLFSLLGSDSALHPSSDSRFIYIGGRLTPYGLTPFMSAGVYLSKALKHFEGTTSEPRTYSVYNRLALEAGREVDKVWPWLIERYDVGLFRRIGVAWWPGEVCG